MAGNGGSIFVKRLQPKGRAKVKAPEFVASAGLQVGDKLGSVAIRASAGSEANS